jgi:SNF2 family DNA or RNA helicase
MFWKPHQYQLNAVKFLLESGSGSLWLEPGLGKTSITLQVIKSLKAAKQIRKVLILAPLRPAHAVWGPEILKWENFENLTYTVLHGAKKDELINENTDIHILNFDGLAWFSNIIARRGVFDYDLLVIDEISYLRNTRTQRFKALSPLLDKFKRRFGLTGSPAPNSLLDIFGPQLVIDRGATFGKYISHFRTKYFYQTGYGGYEYKLLPNAEQQIYEALANKVLRMSAADYLEMPELITNRVYIDLPPGARKVYKELEDQLMTAIGEGSVSALNAAVAVGKCQQVANGAVYLDGIEKETKILHHEKLDAVKDLVEEMYGKPVLIGYHYKHDLAALKEAFPDAPVIGSGVTGDAMNAIIDKWNAGEVPVLLAHPQSAGHGLNLQGAGHAVIWYSLTWSLEIYEQFVRRLWRQGQRNNIVVHQIIARKTVDEAIIKAIERKDNTQQNLLNAIKEYADMSHSETLTQ